jgi:hypothetical protein
MARTHHISGRRAPNLPSRSRHRSDIVEEPDSGRNVGVMPCSHVRSPIRLDDLSSELLALIFRQVSSAFAGVSWRSLHGR